MLPLKNECNIIDLYSDKDFNAASLIPDTVFEGDIIDAYDEIEENIQGDIGMDAMPVSIFNSLLENCLSKGKIRDAMLLTLHANMGVRNSDVSNIKVYEIIKPDRTFRKKIAFGEKKTGKIRNFYINKAMQVALGVFLQSNPNKKMTDYLITSEGNRRKYVQTSAKLKDETYITYTTLAPLSRMQEERIIKNNLIEIGVTLKNDKRCKDGDYKLNTHSLRKLYAEQFAETATVLKKNDILNIDFQILEYVQADLNHNDVSTTMRYYKKFERDKEVIVNEMNIGLEIWLRYISENAT